MPFPSSMSLPQQPHGGGSRSPVAGALTGILPQLPHLMAKKPPSMGAVTGVLPQLMERTPLSMAAMMGVGPQLMSPGPPDLSTVPGADLPQHQSTPSPYPPEGYIPPLDPAVVTPGSLPPNPFAAADQAAADAAKKRLADNENLIRNAVDNPPGNR